VIRRILQWIWLQPWPAPMRRALSNVAATPGVRALLLPQFMVGVVGLISDDRGRILLLRHTYRTDFPWGLPTGFLEHGEQPDRALVREVSEETGLDVELTGLSGVFSDPTRPHIEVVYDGRALGGSFKPSLEIDEIRFCGMEDLPSLRPDQLRLVREALSRGKEKHETTA
jgi:8-oxo-dGTP diphosphatase